MEETQKKITLFKIPTELRFALIWTIFFSIIGITLQYYESKIFIFPDSIYSFFTTTFAEWVRSFGSFSALNFYESDLGLFYPILGKWYYFFYFGGLLALVWGLLSWIIHAEIAITHKSKKSVNYSPQTPNLNQPPTLRQEEKIIPAPKVSVKTDQKTEDLLQKAVFLLSQGKLIESEQVYSEIRKEYKPFLDPSKELYHRIKSFYDALINGRNNFHL